MLRSLAQIQSREGSKGFSLIELLVVVSIMSIAISITVPLLLGQLDRVKANEAKNNLADIYSAEEVFFLEWKEYGSCLKIMGLNIDRVGKYVDGYYALGFSGRRVSDAFVVKHSPANHSLCKSVEAGKGKSWFDASKYVNANHDTRRGQALRPAAECPDRCSAGQWNNTLSAITGTSFVIQASGNISQKLRLDQWTIDHNKNLKHISVGY